MLSVYGCGGSSSSNTTDLTNNNNDTFASDNDFDGIYNSVDNCPFISNPQQLDSDLDGIGDKCDADSDGNGLLDDPLPMHSLNDETYTYEKILEIKAQKGVPGEELLSLSNTLTAYGEYYYALVMEHGTGRPVIYKIHQADTHQIESAYLESSDYLPRADGHHHFSMEIDEKGFLHIVGDMHNYYNSNGNISRTQNHLPLRLQGQHILYWRTTIAEDISSFTFKGQTDATAPKGAGFTYVKLFKDRQGAIYMSSRNEIGKSVEDNAINLNTRGANLTRYDINTQTWTLYGNKPRASENSETRAAVLAYETEAEVDSHFYTKIISSVSFDRANRMHFSVTLNNDNTNNYRDIANANGAPYIYHWNTDLVYLRSNNNEHFVKADSTPVALPAGIDAGSDQADIVYTKNDPHGDSILGIETSITTNRYGNPVIAFTKNKLFLNNLSGEHIQTYARWNGNSWDIFEALGNDNSLDRSVKTLLTGPDGAITFIPKGTARFWRMWSLDGELHQVSSPEGMNHNIGFPSKSFFESTGDILSRVYDKNTETLTIFRIRINKP